MIRSNQKRNGSVILLLVLFLIGLMGMLALAIDIGVIAVARSQAQNAADSAAMAGARTISGDSSTSYGTGSMPSNAVKAAINNKILGTAVSGNTGSIASSGGYSYTSGNVSLQLGSYAYTYNDSSPSSEGFSLQFPRSDSNEPYSAVRATISGTAPLFFGRVFGSTSKNASATASAIHRPRDVMIIMDLSGSMRFQSLLGTPHSGSRTASMNPDPDYPKFGHWSDTTNARMYGNTSISTGSGEYYDPANISYETNSGSAIVEDFYSNAVGVAPSSSNKAFTRKSASYATTPNGDTPLNITLNTGGSYARTLTHFNNSSTTTIPKFEVNGYGQYQTFNGYTEGPSYYGKTFFTWPPNTGFGTPANWSAPTSLTDTDYKWHTWNDSNPRDWRQRFFVAVKTSSSNSPGVVLHNTILYDSSGNLRTPNGSSVSVTENGSSVSYKYYINYAAILYWLQQSPVHFPSTIQAGRIRYYTAVPDGTDTALNNRFWTTAPKDMTNNERFWKSYIDYVLGFQSSSSSTANSYSDISSQIGSGDFFTPTSHTVAVNSHVDRLPSNAHQNPTTPYLTGTTGPHETTTTGHYQSNTTTSAKSTGASSVPVNSLGANPDANVNYVQFGSSTTNYKLTTNSKTTLTITPNLAANVASGATAKVFGSNNAVNSTLVSVADTSLNANDNYVTFNNVSTNIYKVNSTNTQNAGTKLTLNSGLTTAVNMTGDSVQFYVSKGLTGDTMLSVTGLSQAPNTGSKPDYVIINNDTANPYLVTSATNGSDANTYVLTISPGLAADVNITGTSLKFYSPYMDYSDDVKRPRYQMWFGGISFVDWLGNYNTGQFWWPGNVHEAQAWACKAGIQTAIDDIRNNHPNDFVGMAFFSNAMTTRTDTSGFHNRAIVGLGRNYQQLKDSLWFPPTTVTGGVSEITPYDTDMTYVPRANGGTAPGMGFMVAYNQLSSSVTNLRTYATPTDTYRGNAGGLGRRGASRLVIFETDGAPNTSATATFVPSGSDSYYPIRIKKPGTYSDSTNVEWPTEPTYSNTDVYNVVKQICALETASSPGFSTLRKPAQVYSLGYGSLFDTANTSTQQTNGLTFLRTVDYYGGTAADTTPANFPDWQRIYGTNTQRIDRIKTAFTNIMQAGVQVTLIE